MASRAFGKSALVEKSIPTLLAEIDGYRLLIEVKINSERHARGLGVKRSTAEKNILNLKEPATVETERCP